MTLFVDGDQKIHIEACAIMSDRLADAIAAALGKAEGQR